MVTYTVSVATANEAQTVTSDFEQLDSRRRNGHERDFEQTNSPTAGPDYVAVAACESYIHMAATDAGVDGDFDGVDDDHESGGYCNCPTDDCELPRMCERRLRPVDQYSCVDVTRRGPTTASTAAAATTSAARSGHKTTASNCYQTELRQCEGGRQRLQLVDRYARQRGGRLVDVFCRAGALPDASWWVAAPVRSRTRKLLRP